MSLLKMLKDLIAKGFATKAEKEAIKKEVEELNKDDQELVNDLVEEVENLPEEKEEENEEVEKMLKSLMTKNSETLKGEVMSELKKEINTWLAEQKENISKKAGLYSKEVKSERSAINAKMKSIVSALASGDTARMKELTTDDKATPFGGYVVDSELSAEIRHLITEYGVARREMSTIPLTKGDLKANSLTTDPILFWVDEGAVIKSTEIVLGQEKLELKKLGAIVAMTRELIEDSEIDLFAFITQRLAEGFAKAEDLAFFTGAGGADAGNGGFTGVLNNQSVNKYVSSATSVKNIGAEDLLGLIDKTPSGALPNAKFIYHRTFNTLIRTLKDGQGRYLYDPLGAGVGGSIAGYPVIYSEVFPSTTDDSDDTPFILFGDLKKACLLGYKGGIEASIFEAGSIRNIADTADINLITTDRVAMRWTERVGYVVVLPKAISVLYTGSISA